MMRTNSTKMRNLSAVALLAVSVVMPLLLAGSAKAANFTQVEVRFDRMAISSPTTGTVCAMPATTSTDVKTWTVTFPTGYAVSTTAANWQTANISTTNLSWPTGGTAWPNATSATASVSGQTVTWTNASAQTMNSGTLYCYNWTASAALSTKSSASADNSGSVATQNSSAATIDSGSYATATIANDQIVVSASVSQTFSFALSGNTDNLGALSAASVSSSPTPRTVTINTNANGGWQVWAKDSSTGLNSASTSHTIASGQGVNTPGNNFTMSTGSEGYNTGVTSSQTGGSGTITVATGYVGGSTGRGGGLDTSLRSLATSNGTANNAVLTLTNNASIGSLTPAASDYTDTITVVGAGLF